MIAGLAVGWAMLVLLLRLGWRAFWAGIAALCVAGMLASGLLPPDHPLHRQFGADWRAWALPLLLVAAGLAYRAGLVRLKSRIPAAQPPTADPPKGPFTPDELTRYARHILLREVGGPGQRRLKDARVLVVGAGGLGSPAILYLAAAGVGHLTVIDDDRVEPSNLQRQIIHRTGDVGSPKAESAARAVTALNPFVTVTPLAERLTAERAAELFPGHDLILDGTDNFATRELVNAAAVAARRPLIAGAITQWEGQVTLYDPARGGPCLTCLFPEAPAPGLAPTCAEAGVIAPLPGIVGSIMALEAVKVLTGAGEPLRGRMLLWDGLYADTRIIATERRVDCPVCGGAQALDEPDAKP